MNFSCFFSSYDRFEILCFYYFLYCEYWYLFGKLKVKVRKWKILIRVSDIGY